MLEELKNHLNNCTLNGKGDHLVSDCPFCSKSDHFYINIQKAFKKDNKGKYLPCWDCKKCSESGNAKKLFSKLGILNILEQGKYLGFKKVGFLLSDAAAEVSEVHVLPEVKLPIKSRRIGSEHWYLKERGVTKAQAKKYGFYLSKSPKFENYIIVEVMQNGRRVGYLSRYFAKDFDEINRQRETDDLKKLPKWKNSYSDFTYMLNGIDEVKFGVEWVILVEGFFDKTNLEKIAGLDKVSDMVVCQKFGKKISAPQIDLLKKRGIKNVILIEDPDALKETRHNCSTLQVNFEKVLVGYNSEVDLGDSTIVHIERIFNSLKKPLDFKTKIVRPKIKL